MGTRVQSHVFRLTPNSVVIFPHHPDDLEGNSEHVSSVTVFCMSIKRGILFLKHKMSHYHTKSSAFFVALSIQPLCFSSVSWLVFRELNVDSNKAHALHLDDRLWNSLNFIFWNHYKFLRSCKNSTNSRATPSPYRDSTLGDIGPEVTARCRVVCRLQALPHVSGSTLRFLFGFFPFTYFVNGACLLFLWCLPGSEFC